MQKTSKTKLSLRAESIRELAKHDLSFAHGGRPAPTRTGCAGDCDTNTCNDTDLCYTVYCL
jgi:hypothetical protein